MPEPYSFYDTFIGEYPWHPPARDQRRGWEQPDDGVRSIPVPMLVTTAEYVREGGGYDNSIEDSVAGILLSPYLIEHLGLRWTGHDFIYADGNGKSVALDPSARESGPPVLLVDFQQLSELLKSEGMTLVWTVLDLLLKPQEDTKRIKIAADTILPSVQEIPHTNLQIPA